MAMISIEDLQVATTIGAYPWEQALQQKLFISLEIHYDEAKAAETDQLEHALDYAQVAESIKDFCASHQCQLLEKLAHAIADLLHKILSISKLQIKISKPQAILDAKNTAITVNFESKSQSEDKT